MDGRHTYIAIDLKVFLCLSGVYGAGGWIPLRTCLTVADGTRTEKDHLPGSVSGLKVFRDPGTAQAL